MPKPDPTPTPTPIPTSTAVPPATPARESTMWTPPLGAYNVTNLGSGWMSFRLDDKMFLYRIVKSGAAVSQTLVQIQ